ncbi:GHKL domain-containing protein [Niallia taxi]|uniref:GHKL domain-containing protein n=1 Tax=Niallia taxi TaxID=2499688 RepID=UPI0011A55B01|nr:GHKL domain-containing protein [Niallia taxi]MCT2344509.1 GHKL domain-containing protein [Niallia taxi]MDE5054331.1 GHKL domain-containing protein [Niallia taxi]MED3961023.1 GHKL domain-containing protein [Niallia taxi]WOD65118.1 GHKL domain-containing protein [Niallia taxi]
MIIITILNLCANIILANYFFSSYGKIKRRYISKINILLLALFLTSSIMRFIVSLQIVPFINIALTIAILITVGIKNHVPLKKSIFWTSVLIVVSLGCEYLSYLILSSFFPLKQISSYNLIFVSASTSVSTIIEIICIILLKTKVYKRSWSKHQLDLFKVIALTSIPSVSILTLCVAFINEVSSTNLPHIIIPLMFVGTVYMNLCILYLYVSLSNHYEKFVQTTIHNKTLENEMKFYDQVKQSQTEIQAINHDLKNQYLVLLSKLQKGEVEDAINSIRRSLSTLTEEHSTIFTENHTLNFMLNEKNTYALSKGIKFNIKAFLPRKINLQDDVLVAIFGNLLDNSINACKRLTSIEMKEVNLEVDYFKNNLAIEISNHFNTAEIETRKNRLIEGMGIRNVIKAVEENGGIYEQWTKGELYIVSIVLLNITYQE